MGKQHKLAELLIQRSVFADAHLYVHDNRVHDVDAVALESEVADIKHKFLSDRCESLSARAKRLCTKASTQSKLRSNISAAARLATLWLPAAKCMTLHAMRLPNGQVASGGPDVMDSWLTEGEIFLARNVCKRMQILWRSTKAIGIGTVVQCQQLIP